MTDSALQYRAGKAMTAHTAGGPHCSSTNQKRFMLDGSRGHTQPLCTQHSLAAAGFTKCHLPQSPGHYKHDGTQNRAPSMQQPQQLETMHEGQEAKSTIQTMSAVHMRQSTPLLLLLLLLQLVQISFEGR